jgi:hypothetical protein
MPKAKKRSFVPVEDGDYLIVYHQVTGANPGQVQYKPYAVHLVPVVPVYVGLRVPMKFVVSFDAKTIELTPEGETWLLRQYNVAEMAVNGSPLKG